jgi:hypothetical protein
MNDVIEHELRRIMRDHEATETRAAYLETLWQDLKTMSDKDKTVIITEYTDTDKNEKS